MKIFSVLPRLAFEFAGGSCEAKSFVVPGGGVAFVAMMTPTMSGPAAAFMADGSVNPETSGTVISSLGADGVGEAAAVVPHAAAFAGRSLAAASSIAAPATIESVVVTM